MGMKKQPKFIGVTVNPILIIGEKMGNQRKGQDKYALEGNRTGDFVHEAIGDRQNIILTNVVNYYHDFNEHLAEGIRDLEHIIDTYRPSKIICLGGIALKYISKLNLEIPVVHLFHPSFINRFLSSTRADHIQKLRNELN
jgi:hypothetical protein